MRILHIGKYYWPFSGGMEVVVQNLCEGLVRQGDEVRVLCAAESPFAAQERIGGVEVLRQGSFGTYFSQPLTPALFWSLSKLASWADVVHLHMPNPLAELAALLLPRDTPLVVTYHSDVIRQRALLPLYRPLLNGILKRADRIVVPTTNHIEYSAALPQFRDKCSIVPFGIDDRALAMDMDTALQVQQLRAKYGRFFLFVGRLVSYKGLGNLIRAMDHLPANLLVVGDGPLRRQWEVLAHSLGVGHQVHFLGKVRNEALFKACYHGCEALVLPSVTSAENFGMVQLEAMACARPVITTNLPSGVPLVGLANESCLIVPPQDPEALAQAMRQLLADTHLVTQMGQAGRWRYEQLYTLEHMVKSHWDVYQSLVKKAAVYSDSHSKKVA